MGDKPTNRFSDKAAMIELKPFGVVNNGGKVCVNSYKGVMKTKATGDALMRKKVCQSPRAFKIQGSEHPAMV